ncbi:MAG: efflux RND transporter periplasmic adaptor subunit [Paraprevotella sp.]|nr:efflux RND transporter periplasmic adaptor subunit [Paraprevotella sp.]
MRKYFQILMLAGFSMLAVNCSDKKNEAVEQQEEKPKVKLAAVSVRDVKQIEEYTATVESDVKNNISSNSVLRIEKINVEVGDMVRKGQLLVQMNTAMLQQLKLQIENQRVEFNRVDELYKVGGASKSEWDNAKMMLDVNETQYANRLENTQLLSPINGVVTARNYDNGDMPGNMPILTIESLSPVKMKINVSETYYPLVKKGMGVEVRLDVYGDEVFAGKVSLVYPTVDPITHTFPVEITLANANQRVRPGMFARAVLAFGIESRVLVPDQAIVKQMGAGDHYVYVYEGGKVSYNKVQLGRRLGDEYEVISGVPTDAQVVVAGQKKLADGVEVEVVK